MRTIVIIGSALMLAACGWPDDQKKQIDALHAALTADQQKTASLEERVSALEGKTASANAGSWVLWERRKLLQYTGPGIVSGPAPARPSDAFGSKEECQAGARVAAQSHGATPGQDSWVETDQGQLGTTTDQVYYACLPKDVLLKF
jgi:hypothetical protein